MLIDNRGMDIVIENEILKCSPTNATIRCEVSFDIGTPFHSLIFQVYSIQFVWLHG